MKVAVTGLHAVENPSPGLSVARSLRSASQEIELIGYAYHPLYTGSFDRVWNEVRLVSSPLEILSDVERSAISLLIPTIDYELEILCSNDPLSDLLGLPSIDSIHRIAKSVLPKLVDAIGLRVPDTTVASSIDQVESTLAAMSGKGVVKGAVYGGFVVSDAAEGCQIARGLMRSDKFVLVQRWIDGEEFGLAGVAWHGHLLGAVTMRKLGMSEGGTTWCGVSIECGELIDHAKAFCAETKWTGGFELEMIREQATNHNYLIEINARFPSWVFLGTAAGANLPSLLVDAVAGKIPTEPILAKSGVVFARAFTDILRPVSDIAELILEGHLR